MTLNDGGAEAYAASLTLGGTFAATLVILGSPLVVETGASEIASNGTLNPTPTATHGASLDLQSGATMTVDGQINTTGTTTGLGGSGTTIINNGTINANATTTGFAGSVINNGTIDNATGTTVEMDGGTITNAGTVAHPGTITNNGTFNLGGGYATTFFARDGTETGNPITLIGGATLDDDTSAGAGAFTLVGGNTLTGTSSNPGISSGQTVTVDAASSTTEVATSFEIAGTLDLASTAGGNAAEFSPSSGVTVTITGEITTSGPGATALGGASGASIVNNNTIDAEATTTSIQGSLALTNNGNVTVGTTTAGAALDVTSTSGVKATFTNAGGTLTNDGIFTVGGGCTFLARGGTETGNPIKLGYESILNDDTSAGPGSFTAATSFTLTGTDTDPGISPAQTVTLNAGSTAIVPTNFEIAGTLILTGAGKAFFDPATGSTVTLDKGGEIEANGTTGYDQLGSGTGIAATIVNNGVIDAVATQTNMDVAVTNYGTVDTGATTYFYYTVTNDGTISVRATSHVAESGTFSQDSAGILDVTNDVIGGHASSLTAGTYALGGTLDVTTNGTPTNSYKPISSAAKVTGTFDHFAFSGTNYSPSYSSTAVTLNLLASQSISFISSAPSNALVNGTYMPVATATSGLPVTLTIDASTASVCSIAGGIVTFNAMGTCTIDADQFGDTSYSAAPTAMQSFGVGGTVQPQIITFISAAPTNATVGGLTYNVKAMGGGSGNPVTFTSATTAVCTVSGSTVRFVGTGTCTVDADQTGNATFAAAPTTVQTFSVSQGVGNFLHVTTTSLAPGTVGVGYGQTLAASGGNPPYRWKLVKGGAKLPKGLKLNKHTGVISGTPKKNAKSSTFTVEVLDKKIKVKHHHAMQNTATKVLSITIS